MADDTLDTRYLDAVKAGDLAAMDSALKDGADLYTVTGGLCAMSVAIQHGRTEVAAELLRREFDPDFGKDIGATTPLMVACGWGKIDIAKMLISQGANVNYADSFDNDPLCWALEYNYKEAVDLLLDNGANPALARKYGVVLARDPDLRPIVSYLFDNTTADGPEGKRWGEKLAQSLRDGLPQDIGVRVLRLKNSRPSFMKMTL
ncbi:MAG: ankyrin repeat domain-containing protein [Alphaproteobacteria bacterium]